MQLRRFNAEGLRRFSSFVHRVRADPREPAPVAMLFDNGFSTKLPKRIDAEVTDFPSRIAFACWLRDAAAESNAVVPSLDEHFWAWLTLLLFDQVCPLNAVGKRKVREPARYLLKPDDPLRSPRHALAGAYAVLEAVGSSHAAEPLLCGPLSVVSDQAYQRFTELSLVHHPGAVAALRTLYFDEETRQMRPRSSTDGAGGIRRFTKLLKQYARTYDLDVVSGERITAMLPREFNRWKPDSDGNAPSVFSTCGAEPEG